MKTKSVDTWTPSKYYEARIKGESEYIRLVKYNPVKDQFLCRVGKEKEIYFADELADYCLTV